MLKIDLCWVQILGASARPVGMHTAHAFYEIELNVANCTTDNEIRQRWECDFDDFEVSQAFQNHLRSSLKTQQNPIMNATQLLYRFGM